MGMDRDLLQELLAAYGPCGAEDTVREVCRRELEPQVDEAWVDPAGNLVGSLHGGEAPATPDWVRWRYWVIAKRSAEY
jgi:putative aminopeptidase FrvX